MPVVGRQHFVNSSGPQSPTGPTLAQFHFAFAAAAVPKLALFISHPATLILWYKSFVAVRSARLAGTCSALIHFRESPCRSLDL
jgi:hypothetical protein